MKKSTETRKGLDRFEVAAEKYTGMESVRALIQLIPLGIGSAIDSLFGNRGERIQSDRLKALLDGVRQRVEQLEETKIDRQFLQSDDFFFFCKDIFARVAASRTMGKVDLFRQVFLNGLYLNGPDREFLATCNAVLSEIDETEILILRRLTGDDCRAIRIDERFGFLEGQKPGENRLLSDIGPMSAAQFQYSAKRLVDLGLVWVFTTDSDDFANFSRGRHIRETELARELVKVVLHDHAMETTTANKAIDGDEE